MADEKIEIVNCNVLGWRLTVIMCSASLCALLLYGAIKVTFTLISKWFIFRLEVLGKAKKTDFSDVG